VTSAEVVKVDAVRSAADGHLVLERPLRHAALPFSLKIGIFSMFAFVFSWTTTSTVAGKSTLPLT
jgi:hypothetical protein